jgi:iron complex transport system substrate-binding protein
MPPRDLSIASILDPAENITRRRLLTAVPGVVLLAGGVACGDDDEPVAADPTSTPAASGKYPREITHEKGITTVPAPPKRVVAISDFNDLDYLLVLGVEPVLYGFTNAWDGGAMPWQLDAAKAQKFDADGETDLEAIAAAKPHLIVTMPPPKDGYNQLAKIAPTVVLGWSTPWRAGLRMIASSMGLEEDAEASIKETEAVLAGARGQLAPLASKQVMVGFQYRDSFFIWGKDALAMQVLREMGVNAVGGPEADLSDVSLEQVNLLEKADILLSVASDPSGIKTQEASPLFRGIPAVKNGGYDVPTVVQSRALGDGASPLSLPWVVPQVIDLLKRLAAGNGKKLA